MNTIGKPCEGKLQARFDEGGTANGSNLLFSLAGSTLPSNCVKNRLDLWH
jgi:hypothetical protein